MSDYKEYSDKTEIEVSPAGSRLRQPSAGLRSNKGPVSQEVTPGRQGPVSGRPCGTRTHNQWIKSPGQGRVGGAGPCCSIRGSLLGQAKERRVIPTNPGCAGTSAHASLTHRWCRGPRSTSMQRDTPPHESSVWNLAIPLITPAPSAATGPRRPGGRSGLPRFPGSSRVRRAHSSTPLMCLPMCEHYPPPPYLELIDSPNAPRWPLPASTRNADRPSAAMEGLASSLKARSRSETHLRAPLGRCHRW